MKEKFKFTMSFKIRNFSGPVHEIFSLEIVGNYSINDERKYSNDITQLKYYKKLLNSRNVKFDLDLSNNTIYVLEEDMKLNFML